jgi:hypothetical protein
MNTHPSSDPEALGYQWPACPYCTEAALDHARAGREGQTLDCLEKALCLHVHRVEEKDDGTRVIS